MPPTLFSFSLKRSLFASLFLLAASAAVFGAEPQNWPCWRGPNGDGVAAPGDYPEKFSEPSAVLWRSALPGKGMSTPIIWNRRIFLTAPSNGKDAVLAFDWAGKQLWVTEIGVERPGRHKNASGSNPTPITDGKSVFVVFKSGNFVALDFEGKVLWSVNLIERFGPDTLYWDYGASPVIAGSNVIVTRMHHGESWIAAFDRGTGEMRWKVARNFQVPQENDNGYTTPVVLRRDGREQLLLWGAEHVTLHDAADGKLLWRCGGFNKEGIKNWPAVATPVVVGDMVLVPYGRADRAMPQLHGIKLGGSGDQTATARKWYRKNIGTFVPTAAVRDGRVYMLRDQGDFECINPVTGEAYWAGSLPKSGAKYYGSVLLIGDRMFAVREDGAFFVVGVSGRFEVLEQGHIGDRVIASPIAVEGRLFVRGDKSLICFGKK